MSHRMLATAEVQLLVERAKCADPDAWEALYRHAYPRLHNYARRRLAGDDQADDAVSETMTRAIDRIDDFTWRGAGFDGWLYGILRNVVREAYRHGARHPVIDLDLYPEIPAEGDIDPADSLIALEEAEEVRAAFAKLSRFEQELLELRVVGELDAEAVGAVTGRRPGAVRMAQSRAFKRLRTLLDEDRR